MKTPVYRVERQGHIVAEGSLEELREALPKHDPETFVDAKLTRFLQHLQDTGMAFSFREEYSAVWLNDRVTNR